MGIVDFYLYYRDLCRSIDYGSVYENEMTTYSFKNGITIDIPAESKEQEIQKWHDIKWMMSLFIDPPPMIPPPEEKKEYTLSYKGYEKRKLKDKARDRAKRKKK